MPAAAARKRRGAGWAISLVLINTSGPLSAGTINYVTSPAEPGWAQRDRGQRDFTVCTRWARCPLRPPARGARKGRAAVAPASTSPATARWHERAGQPQPHGCAKTGCPGWVPGCVHPAVLLRAPRHVWGQWAVGNPPSRPASLHTRPAPGCGHCSAAPRLRPGIMGFLPRIWGGIWGCGGGESGAEMGIEGARRVLGFIPALAQRPRGPPQGFWGSSAHLGAPHSPRHLAQQGLSLLAGLVQAAGGHSWRWQCVSPDCGAERGAECGGRRDGGSLGHGGSPQCHAALLSRLSPKHWGLAWGHLSFPRCHPRPGTLTTHQHRIHFISPKGGTEGCQLSLLRYQRRPKRHARGPSACMVSASSGTLFSGAAGKGTGRGHPHGRGTPWHRQRWH